MNKSKFFFKYWKYVYNRINVVFVFTLVVRELVIIDNKCTLCDVTMTFAIVISAPITSWMWSINKTSKCNLLSNVDRFIIIQFHQFRRAVVFSPFVYVAL